jgi:hypothetical protein
MNGMYKNSRGLRDLVKHLHIAQCINDHNLDFIGISETNRRDFPQSLLNHLSGDIDFEWTPWPPRGRSGGILLGVRTNIIEVLASLGGDYHIKLYIHNRVDNFIWNLVAVYGAAQDEFKDNFLRELVNLEKDNLYPILIGGDFNLLRFCHEKSKGRDHWPFLFNAVIDSLDLREVTMIGRQFTWVNSLPDLTYEKFDKVLMDADMESKFPLVLRALERIEGLSDHAPILSNTGTPRPPGKHRFKFQLGRLQ